MSWSTGISKSSAAFDGQLTGRPVDVERLRIIAIIQRVRQYVTRITGCNASAQVSVRWRVLRHFPFLIGMNVSPYSSPGLGTPGRCWSAGARRTLLAESSWAVLSSPSLSSYMALARSLLPTSPAAGVYIASRSMVAPSLPPVMGLLPLYHCQVMVFAHLRCPGHPSVAVITTSTWGCNVDRVTVPGSSTLVTSMVTFFRSGRVLTPPSDAWTVTAYNVVGVRHRREPQSQGNSRNAAPRSLSRSPRHIIAVGKSQSDRLALRIRCPKGRHGSSCRSQRTSSGASPSKSGISSTLVTLMVTVMVELAPSESVAVTVTV